MTLKRFTSKIDLLFGGGAYDHMKAYRQGLTVAPWPRGEEPTEIWKGRNGKDRPDSPRDSRSDLADRHVVRLRGEYVWDLLQLRPDRRPWFEVAAIELG